jgi:hypothetical protein
MPTSISKDNILQVIADEAMGFSFGKPDRPSEKSLACILPIIRKSSQKRQYITMPETEKVIVTDSGSISKLNLKNTGKDNVFIRSGTIFEGKGTQSRALTRSAVLFPGDEVGLDVRCVHASHGIRSGSEFKYGGVTPTSVESANYASGFTPRNQTAMWASVASTTRTMNRMYKSESPLGHGARRPSGSLGRRVMPSRSAGLRSLIPQDEPTHMLSDSPIEEFAEPVRGSFFSSAFSGDDNLKSNFDQFAKNFEGILSKARLHDDQVGLSLITDSGCQTIEAFDLPLSWEALHKDAVKRMGTELLRGPDTANVFKYKPENAVNAVKKVLGLPFKSNLIYEHKPSNGEPHVTIFGLTAADFVGEVVELDDRVIHLLLLKTVAA